MANQKAETLTKIPANVWKKYIVPYLDVREALWLRFLSRFFSTKVVPDPDLLKLERYVQDMGFDVGEMGHLSNPENRYIVKPTKKSASSAIAELNKKRKITRTKSKQETQFLTPREMLAFLKKRDESYRRYRKTALGKDLFGALKNYGVRANQLHKLHPVILHQCIQHLALGIKAPHASTFSHRYFVRLFENLLKNSSGVDCIEDEHKRIKLKHEADADNVCVLTVEQEECVRLMFGHYYASDEARVEVLKVRFPEVIKFSAGNNWIELRNIIGFCLVNADPSFFRVLLSQGPGYISADGFDEDIKEKYRQYSQETAQKKQDRVIPELKLQEVFQINPILDKELKTSERVYSGPIAKSRETIISVLGSNMFWRKIDPEAPLGHFVWESSKPLGAFFIRIIESCRCGNGSIDEAKLEEYLQNIAVKNALWQGVNHAPRWLRNFVFHPELMSDTASQALEAMCRYHDWPSVMFIHDFTDSELVLCLSYFKFRLFGIDISRRVVSQGHKVEILEVFIKKVEQTKDETIVTLLEEDSDKIRKFVDSGVYETLNKLSYNYYLWFWIIRNIDKVLEIRSRNPEFWYSTLQGLFEEISLPFRTTKANSIEESTTLSRFGWITISVKANHFSDERDEFVKIFENIFNPELSILPRMQSLPVLNMVVPMSNSFVKSVYVNSARNYIDFFSRQGIYESLHPDGKHYYIAMCMIPRISKVKQISYKGKQLLYWLTSPTHEALIRFLAFEFPEITSSTICSTRQCFFRGEYAPFHPNDNCKNINFNTFDEIIAFITENELLEYPNGCIYLFRNFKIDELEKKSKRELHFIAKNKEEESAARRPRKVRGTFWQETKSAVNQSPEHVEASQLNPRNKNSLESPKKRYKVDGAIEEPIKAEKTLQKRPYAAMAPARPGDFSEQSESDESSYESMNVWPILRSTF